MTRQYSRPARPVHLSIGTTIANGVAACPSSSLLLTTNPEFVSCARCKRTGVYRRALDRRPKAAL